MNTEEGKFDKWDRNYIEENGPLDTPVTNEWNEMLILAVEKGKHDRWGISYTDEDYVHKLRIQLNDM